MQSFYLLCMFMVTASSFIRGANAAPYAEHETSTTSGATTSSGIHKIEKLTQALDVILREIRRVMLAYKMDPFQAPDQTSVGYIFTLDMNNIQVCNLSTIRRLGDIVMMDNAIKRTLTTHLLLTFDDLQVMSDYKVSGLMLTLGGKLTARIPELIIDFTLEIDFENVKLKMLEFAISKMGTIEVNFRGNIEAFFMNILLNVAVRIIGDLLMSVIGGTVKTQIDEILLVVNGLIKETLQSYRNGTSA